MGSEYKSNDDGNISLILRYTLFHTNTFACWMKSHSVTLFIQGFLQLPPHGIMTSNPSIHPLPCQGKQTRVRCMTMGPPLPTIKLLLLYAIMLFAPMYEARDYKSWSQSIAYSIHSNLMPTGRVTELNRGIQIQSIRPGSRSGSNANDRIQSFAPHTISALLMDGDGEIFGGDYMGLAAHYGILIEL